MKEKSALTNLPEIIVRLTHNASKFNSRVITTTKSLKRNGSSDPDLLHQLSPTYLIYPDKQFHDYVVLKQNKFEEYTAMKPEYLMKYVSYKYKILLDKGEW